MLLNDSFKFWVAPSTQLSISVGEGVAQRPFWEEEQCLDGWWVSSGVGIARNWQVPSWTCTKTAGHWVNTGGSDKKPPRQHPALPHRHRCWIWWLCHNNESTVLSSCLWSAPSTSSSRALPSYSQTSPLPSLLMPCPFFFCTCPTHSCLLTRFGRTMGSWSLRSLNVLESPSDIIGVYLSIFLLTDRFQCARAPVDYITEDEPQ